MTNPVVIEPSQVRQPSAMAGPVHSATFKLGEILKDVLRKSGSYHNETDLHAALNAVDTWVRSIVPLSAHPALADGMQSAPHEDVTKRIPPGGMPAIISTAPAIDYDRLAAAILAAQQQAMAARQAEPGMGQ